MGKILLILISALSLGACQGSEAAPAGSAGNADLTPNLTTNLHVVDSSSPPVVVGEVVGLDGYFNPIVALSPSLENTEPPLLVRALGYNPYINPSGVTLLGTGAMYYTDATCSTTPYFAVSAGVITPSGVVVTSTGATTSYHIYKAGVGPLIPQVAFNSMRDPTSPTLPNGGVDFGACQLHATQRDAIQGEAMPYFITLTPPFKLKNP